MNMVDMNMVDMNMVDMDKGLEMDMNMDNSYVNGSIDLVFKKEGGWTIVGYKTWASTEVEHRLAAKYQAQLDAYKEAWVKATGQAVVKTEIFFLEKI